MILVTGGTGFIGKQLIPELSKIDDVRVLSRGYRSSKFKVFKADISNKKQVQKAMKDVDVVFHLAKFKGHNYPYKKHYPTTVLGTKNVIEAAIKQDVEKIVYMSTAGVTMKNVTPYARAKKEAENIVKKHWKDIEIPVLRTTMVYDQSILRKLRKYTTLPFPYMKHRIHLCYKDSLIRALINAMKYGKSDVYNVMDKKCIMFKDFFRELAKPRPILFIPPQLNWFLIGLGYPVEAVSNLIGAKPPFTPTYIKYSFEDRCFNIKKAEKTLKYRPVDTINMVRKLRQKT